MIDIDFLGSISNSFKRFLETGSRSNEKLKILHGAVATDLQNRLGEEFTVKSLGLGDGKEQKIKGRYLNKVVDLTIQKHDSPIAGIGIKFVMQNYAQNSNNYFENMLGETANIRSERIQYFQILIIPERMPYFNNKGQIARWDSFTQNNAKKYLLLSKDNIDSYLHTPTKTLLFIIKLPELSQPIADKPAYIRAFKAMKGLPIEKSNLDFGEFQQSVILNDYDLFMKKIVFSIKSI